MSRQVFFNKVKQFLYYLAIVFNIFMLFYLIIYHPYILLFLVGVIISIGLHELGHMYFMKKYGVRVLEYSIGFGPKLFTFYVDKDYTEYNVRLFPLGGYVKPIDDKYETEYKKEKEKYDGKIVAYKYWLDLKKDENGTNTLDWQDFMFSKKLYQKILILVAGVFMNIVLAVGCIFSFMQISTMEKTPDYNNIVKYNNSTEYKIREESSKDIIKEIKPEVGASLWLGTKHYDFDNMSSLEKLETALYETKKGLLLSWLFTKYIIDNPGELYRLQSLIGISKDIGLMEKYNLSNIAIVLLILGLINLSLAVLNILPIPVLDGGHVVKEIVFAIMDKLAIIKDTKQFDISYWYFIEFSFFVFFTGLGVIIMMKDVFLY